MTEPPSAGAPGGERTAPSESARAKTIDLLSDHFAQDDLSLEDFEGRVDRVHRAKTMADLEATVSGLPTRSAPAPVGDTNTEVVPHVSAGVVADRVRPTDRAVAVFGEAKRLGRWTPARETHVVAVMGSAVLDLREALLGPGESTIKVVTCFGSVEVIVPPGLYVECNGSAVFGSFEHRQASAPPLDPNVPVVRIEGFAVFGSVEVESRYAEESKREARVRRRLEKRERRRERKAGRRLSSGG